MLEEHIASKREALDDICKFICIRTSGTMSPLYPPISEGLNTDRHIFWRPV